MDILISLLLILGSVFFVAAEYSIVSARRSRLETLGRRGSKRAKELSKELEDVSVYVAGSQIGITMIGIGVGSITEPSVTHWLSHLFPPTVSLTVSFALSFLLVSFVLVVLGELCPKYAALHAPEKVALLTFRPLKVVVVVLKPLIWLAQTTAHMILKLFRIDLHEHRSEGVPKEELLVLVQSGGAEGTLDKMHAEMVAKALKLDVLAARDIMVHRLDIKWLDESLDKDGLLKRLRDIPFTRLPVCRGDIDDMAGVVYLHDIVRHLTDADFDFKTLLRPVVAIPENLTMEKIVATMRDQKTQILIVMDEYGGTSGLITLEDVVEEVFGELEDRLESERPTIERLANGRVSARADVRFDELIDRLNLPLMDEENTDTLATIIVNGLERVPRPGDSVQTEIGLMRVENMARRRITRVSIQLSPEMLNPPAE